MLQMPWSGTVQAIDSDAARVAGRLVEARARVAQIEDRLAAATREGRAVEVWQEALEHARRAQEALEEFAARHEARRAELQMTEALASTSREALRESYALLREAGRPRPARPTARPTAQRAVPRRRAPD
jgi:hypothetical protein